MFHKTICSAGLLVFASTFAQAGADFQHPALGGQPNLGTSARPVVLVGHPASPRWQLVHANAEHPAVLQAARAAAIDPNLFIVQPPASTQWTQAPVESATVAAAR